MTKAKHLMRTSTAVMLSGLTLGALASVAPLANAATGPVGTTTASQQHSDYSRGYRDGYRAGYRDGNTDGHRACHHRMRYQMRRAGEYNRGYSDGYSRGYDTRFNEVCRHHR
ncbi:hypothetical protein AB0L06_40950 [Spirillospora sp. NPDC052269]